MTSRDAFGPDLRSQRERRGVTLESIERTTNVSRSLFAALERNDLSRWPGGLYRRSFFRAYAAAVGLQPEPLLLDLARLFPEPGHDVPDLLPPDADEVFRLELVPEARWRTPVRRIASAAIDAGLVLLPAMSVAGLSGANLWVMSAGIGLGYHALSTLCLGRTVGSWCLDRGKLARLTPRSASSARDVADLRRDWLSDVVGASLAGIRHPAEDSSVPSA